MHHKRLPELNATLHSLARASGASRLRITVTQSLDSSDAAAADATGALLKSLRLPFQSLKHLPQVRAPEARSYSTDAARYGTKRGSCRNLLHGLEAVFGATPSLTAALVIEDDVRLSADVFEFFDLAASIVAASHGSAHTAAAAGGGSGAPAASADAPPVALASAFCYPRDTHEDYSSSRLLPGRLLAGGAEHYRHSRLHSLTFRTLAWLITRPVYDAMRLDFLDGSQPMLALPDGAPLHSSMAGCSYCENLCYDHWLEWRWREAGVVCPARPRAQAEFSGGMTEHRGILRAGGDEGYHARVRAGTGELNEASSVRSGEFVDDSARRGAARHLRRLSLLALCLLLLLLARAAWPVGKAWLMAHRRRHSHAYGKVDSDDVSRRTAQSRGVRLPRLRACRVVAHRIPRCCLAAALLSWLGIGLLVYRRWRGPPCLPLPPHWRNASDSLAEPLQFVLLWSTDAASFTLRARRCLESIFFHHPRSSVKVYSNELPLQFFAPFSKLGYDVRVQRYDATQLLSGTPAAPWLERLSEWQRGPYYYSHVTDAIRLALLLRVGGVYMDTDVLLTRPLQLIGGSSSGGGGSGGGGSSSSGGGGGGSGSSSERHRAVTEPVTPGASGARHPGETAPPLHDALGVEAYADPRTRRLMLNGAVMAFGRGSRFLWNALHEFAADYKADRWGWNGPELLTRVVARCANVQVEPPETFYPLHWDDIARYADGSDPARDRKLWDQIVRRSYTVHVWNRKTAKLTFAKGSLLHKLHNTFMVLPGREECT